MPRYIRYLLTTQANVKIEGCTEQAVSIVQPNTNTYRKPASKQMLVTVTITRMPASNSCTAMVEEMDRKGSASCGYASVWLMEEKFIYLL